MITISGMGYKHIFQRTYDQTVKNLPIHSLECTCGAAGSLIRYGYYFRYIRYRGEKILLRIQRIRCKFCGKTHALIPEVLVPCSQIPLEDQIDLIAAYESGERFEKVLNRNPLLVEREAYQLIRKYVSCWKERCRSAGISLQKDLTAACFRHFSRQFMQIRSVPNILSPAAT